MGSKLIMGIDPGLKGAIAVLESEEPSLKGSPRLIDVIDLPTIKTQGPRKDARAIDFHALGVFVDRYASLTKLAVIEDVGVMTGKEGRVSMFNFGYSTGGITGVISAFMIPYFKIRPAIWKSLMGVTCDKNSSREKASLLFPEQARLWARAKDDGRAEAVLIAYLGLTRFKDQLK